jgi:glycosyltransferase involved in cell wall biosynthesis
MGCQVPVVASDVGGLPEVVEHGASGFLAPVGDMDKMSQYALQILDDQQLGKRFGARGRQIAQSKYAEETIVGLYEDYYHEVLGG